MKPEGKSKEWCTHILKKKLSKIVITQKLAALEKHAKITFPKNGCFTMPWLSSVVQKIDELWYDGQMIPNINKAYKNGLELFVEVVETKVAGYVLENDNTITLHMNRELFSDLFQKKEQGYHSGGLLCKDRLICLLHVILHETVHLVLTVCDKLGYRPDIRDHGKEFNRIVYNLFGQTDPQHGLIPGYEAFHDLQTIRQAVHVGSNVEIFVEGMWLPGIVQKKGYKWVHVDCGSKHGSFTLHVGLIRLPKGAET
jgi:hypothetical protein